jgi:hypothetical protein
VCPVNVPSKINQSIDIGYEPWPGHVWSCLVRRFSLQND